ncbi:MAG TPA: DUF2510 domain-containing protein [Thermoleophilaceae bacterium]|jgi:hypothetical protein
MTSGPPPKPPGWYDDPWGVGGLRWWDGNDWTAQVAPKAGAPKKRPIWPWILAGSIVVFLVTAGVIAGVVLVVVNSDSGEHHESSSATTTTTTPETSTTPSTPTRPYVRARSNRLPEVGLGRAVKLRTQDAPSVRVTALSVVDPVSAGTYTLRPKRGSRWIGVRMRLKNLGPGHLSDAPGNAAKLHSKTHAYKAGVSRPDGCHALPAVIELDPGDEASGCLIFEVPRGTEVNRLELTLSSGYAPDVATWRLR